MGAGAEFEFEFVVSPECLGAGGKILVGKQCASLVSSNPKELYDMQSCVHIRQGGVTCARSL